MLEEGASFWDPPLVWRIFFCAMTAVCLTSMLSISFLDYLPLVPFPGSS